MNQRFGKDFYRKGNSVKSFGPFVNRRTLKTEKLLSSSPARKSALNTVGTKIIADPEKCFQEFFSKDS